jgi:hypothetical protein
LEFKWRLRRRDVESSAWLGRPAAPLIIRVLIAFLDGPAAGALRRWDAPVPDREQHLEDPVQRLAMEPERVGIASPPRKIRTRRRMGLEQDGFTRLIPAMSEARPRRAT